jgi:hypothetical protein
MCVAYLSKQYTLLRLLPCSGSPFPYASPLCFVCNLPLACPLFPQAACADVMFRQVDDAPYEVDLGFYILKILKISVDFKWHEL